MSWLDNLIGFVSPKAAYMREAWRLSLDEVRNYDAGDQGRLNANWRVMNQSGEMTDRSERDIIRARARDLERNSDMMNAVIGAFERNIVGGGYTLQARTPDEKINNQLEKYWKQWVKKQNCDVTNQQSFNQMLRMCVQRKKVDGGVLIHKTYTRGGVVPFKLQLLEVDELDSSQMTPRKKGNKVIGGIEYNGYNRPEGYWIRQYPVDGFSIEDPIYIPEKDMIFYFTKKRPSQVREISDMTTTMTRIRDTNEFITAVSVKQRIMACLSVFIKKIAPGGGIGRGINSTSDQYNYNGKMLVPGMIKELNPGEEVETVNPGGQSDDATNHIKTMQHLIGAGQGLSYEATSRDMSQTNYSSARQSMIEDDMTYAKDKELLQEIMDEIYETFVISGVLSGLFEIKDFWQNKEEYLAHEWFQQPKRWIDPLKESSANKTALQTGQKTFQQISAENGKDWREQIEEMANVIQYGKEKGVEMGGVIYGQQYNGQTNDTGV